MQPQEAYGRRMTAGSRLSSEAGDDRLSVATECDPSQRIEELQRRLEFKESQLVQSAELGQQLLTRLQEVSEQKESLQAQLHDAFTPPDATLTLGERRQLVSDINALSVAKRELQVTVDNLVDERLQHESVAVEQQQIIAQLRQELADARKMEGQTPINSSIHTPRLGSPHRHSFNSEKRETTTPAGSPVHSSRPADVVVEATSAEPTPTAEAGQEWAGRHPEPLPVRRVESPHTETSGAFDSVSTSSVPRTPAPVPPLVGAAAAAGRPITSPVPPHSSILPVTPRSVADGSTASRADKRNSCPAAKRPPLASPRVPGYSSRASATGTPLSGPSPRTTEVQMLRAQMELMQQQMQSQFQAMQEMLLQQQLQQRQPEYLEPTPQPQPPRPRSTSSLTQRTEPSTAENTPRRGRSALASHTRGRSAPAPRGDRGRRSVRIVTDSPSPPRRRSASAVRGTFRPLASGSRPSSPAREPAQSGWFAPVGRFVGALFGGAAAASTRASDTGSEPPDRSSAAASTAGDTDVQPSNVFSFTGEPEEDTGLVFPGAFTVFGL